MPAVSSAVHSTPSVRDRVKNQMCEYDTNSR